jgi:hypothetical protein
MKVPVIGTIDERFLTHRLRSTSNGGLAGVVVATAFFFYNLSHHLISWDLFAVVASAAIVKIAFMIYYRLTD